MSDIVPAKYTIRTAYGKFHMKISAAMDRNKIKADAFNVNIGSKTKQCAQFTVPLKHTGHTDAKLIWIEAHEECSLETYIQKGLAQHMILLGITVVRHINTSIKTIYFDDMSSFMCALPNGKEQQVPMKPFHIAFHGATWYEYYFDAKLKKDHDKYLRLKENLFRAEAKPATFDFINQELQEELEPLYDGSSTWHEFFTLIDAKYGNKKCSVIYPWLVQAMNHIFEGSVFFEVKWYIDLEENLSKNKTPMIPSEIARDDGLNGGKRDKRNKRNTRYRSTIKQRLARQFTAHRLDIFPHIPQIQSWNYRKFLAKTS